jgi:hypothetical protein
LKPDAEALTGEESAELAKGIPRFENELVATTLEVLEAIGAPAALDKLRSIEYAWTYGRKKEGTELPALLRRTITCLGARLEEQRKRDTLLRPASSNENLLRATIDTPVADPALLLRAGED